VAGTAEPIYGPEALHSVAKQEDQNPKYEITDDDLKWQALETTCAETQTFYTETDGGHFVMVQVIYSNVAWVIRCLVFGEREPSGTDRTYVQQPPHQRSAQC